MQGKSVPHYAAIEPNGDGLMIISYKPFKFLQEEKEILKENDDKKTTDEKKGKTYLTGYDRLLSVLAKKRACLEILVNASLNICLKWCFFFFPPDLFIYLFHGQMDFSVFVFFPESCIVHKPIWETFWHRRYIKNFFDAGIKAFCQENCTDYLLTVELFRQKLGCLNSSI